MKDRKKFLSVAFIPARMGSERIKDKNIYILDKHPMIAYSIRSAIDSKIFDKVICATDSKQYAEIAKYYGAEVPFLRPSEISNSTSADIEWVSYCLEKLNQNVTKYDIFSILRPTSPFRSSKTISRAYEEFIKSDSADSLRAVEKCKQHPGKMWVTNNKYMTPLLPFKINNTPWHSHQFKSLPEIYIQNASIEIAWTKTINLYNTISGDMVLPFFTKKHEGFDINLPEDLDMAKKLIDKDRSVLPKIEIPAYK